MRQAEPVTEQILDVLAQSPGLLIEELAWACPALTWNQVFLEVDRLSRAGHLELKAEGPGLYSVSPARTTLEMRLLTQPVLV
jgi:hypothetical protein